MTEPIFDADARRAQMFPRLPPGVIARLRAAGSERSFADRDVVFAQGDRQVPFFVVLEGELEIVHPRGRSEDLVTVHGPGEFTGEASVLLDRRALVCARAKGPLRVLRIENAKLRGLLQSDAELSEIVMRAFILRRLGLLSSGLGDAVVVGSRNSAGTLRLEAFLERNGHPHRYLDVDRDADMQSLLDELRVDVTRIPMLICCDGKVVHNPSDAEAAELLGFNPTLEPAVVHDVVICGAGPGGLAAAVYGASEGLDVLVLEATAPGGQAASSSKIENYLGFPTGVSGQALAGRALAQAEKFGAKLAVARGAVRLFCEERPMRVELADGASVCARAIVIATGAEYRKLDVPDLAKFEGVGVYYAATLMEARRCGDEEVIVVGGANSAGQAATFLAERSRHVHLVVRGANLVASMSRYLIRRIEDTPNISLYARTRVVALHGGEHLEAVTWRDASGAETRRPIRHLFTMAGASPNTAWLEGCVALDAKGFVRTDTDLGADELRAASWPLARAPYLFETTRPRVFAVGDVRANSVKRVASAVGEGSVCIQLVHKALAE